MTERLINKPQQINNNTVNININAFDSSNMDVLQDKDFIEALLKGKNCIIKLIESVHFNTKHPENFNIYKTNFRDKN